MRQHETERVRGGVMTKAMRRVTQSTIMEAIGRFSGPVIAGLILLVLGKVWAMNDGFIKLEASMGVLTAAVTSLNSDRYTATEAGRVTKHLQDQIDEIKKRPEQLVVERPRLTVRAQVPARAK